MFLSEKPLSPGSSFFNCCEILPYLRQGSAKLGENFWMGKKSFCDMKKYVYLCLRNVK
jgi:hypothetical protein